jgi:hypothetical protein
MRLKCLRKCHLPARATGIGLAILLLAGGPANAQSSSACLRHPAKLSDSVLDDFKARPKALLAKHPEGGVLMSAAVRRLAGSNVSTVPVLCSLAREASVAQTVALGVGLAKTYGVCKRLRPDLAQRIKEEVERTGIQALITVFVASLPSDAVAMGAPEEPTPALLAEEELRFFPFAGEAPYAGAQKKAGIPQSFFGNGGIAQTVVRPVSPSR